jgi:hypothetical protein
MMTFCPQGMPPAGQLILLGSLYHLLLPMTRILIFLIWCAKQDWGEALFQLRPLFKVRRIMAVLTRTEALGNPTYEQKETAWLRGELVWIQVVLSIILPPRIHWKMKIDSKGNDSI